MRATLSPDRRERLIAALEHLASDDATDRAAAGLEVTITLRSVGLPWDALLITAAPPVRVRKLLPPPPAGSEWREDLLLCRKFPGYLRPWEVAFLEDLRGTSGPTRKQAVVLAEVAAGLRARGLA